MHSDALAKVTHAHGQEIPAQRATEMKGSPLFGKKKGEKPGEESRTGKLRQSATDLLKNPKVRREAERLARDPRVQRKAFDLAKRAAQRFRRK